MYIGHVAVNSYNIDCGLLVYLRIMTRLWADQQRNQGSIPGRDKHSVGSGVHSVSYSTGTGSHSHRDKETRQ
jgi:hypothetical protein